MTTRYYRADMITPNKFRLKICANGKVMIECEVNRLQLDQLRSLCLQWVHEGLSITDVDEAFKRFFENIKEV